jgi:hypothetical protein
MRVENCHPRGKPWWIRPDEKGKSHECIRVTFSKRVSTSTSRPLKSATKAGARFLPPPARRPNAEAQCRRLADDPARRRRYRLARPGRSESTPDNCSSKYTPRSRPRALIHHNRRDTTTTRESRLQLARQRSPFDSDQIATVKSPLRIPVGGTSPRKTCSAHQNEAYHGKTNNHLRTSRNCL